MKTVSHYLSPIDKSKNVSILNFGSREELSSPLVVNCAGFVDANYNHTNTNPSGRLDFYLIYLVSGKIEFLGADTVTPLTEGDLIIYPPKTPYKYRCIASNGNVRFFWVHFTGSDAEKILKKYGLCLFPHVHKISINNHIDARFKSLFDGFAINDSFRESDLASLLDRLLIEIGRVLSTEGTGNGRLHKSVRYLNENFSESIKIPELAKMENMCMTTFNLHFKKYVGVTPTKYIIKLYLCYMIYLDLEEMHMIDSIMK